MQFFQTAYANDSIAAEDLFYFIYGLLHSQDYRELFQFNFVKQLPRIPILTKHQDFQSFREAGKQLADLHLNYEEVYPYQIDVNIVKSAPSDDSLYKVDRPWKFFGKRPKLDRTRVKYNQYIDLSGIPLEAYEYEVNGKSALEWVMERQSIRTDRNSGIVNDANCFAIEARNNPKYPLELFQRVITVSLETMKIARSLPDLKIRDIQ